MNNYLKQLDSWLSEYSGKVNYGHPFTVEDLQQFETDSKITLPKDLGTFYHWNNGIKIGDDFQFFSLEEALIIHRNEWTEGETAETPSEMPVDDAVFSSPEEARRFQEEFQKYKKTRRKDKNYFLPLFAEYRASVTNYYALCLSEIDQEDPDWLLIETKTYPKPFYIKIRHLRHNRTIHCFAELPELLAESLNRLKPPTPPRTSLWQELKDVVNIIGSFFER